MTIEEETRLKWKNSISSLMGFSKSLVMITAGFLFPWPVMAIWRMSLSSPRNHPFSSHTLRLCFWFDERSTRMFDQELLGSSPRRPTSCFPRLWIVMNKTPSSSSRDRFSWLLNLLSNTVMPFIVCFPFCKNLKNALFLGFVVGRALAPVHNEWCPFGYLEPK